MSALMLLHQWKLYSWRSSHLTWKGLHTKKGHCKLTFLTSLLDLNVCGTKESLSIASISFTRFTCSTRVAWSSSFLFFASSSLLSLAFKASSALAAASSTSCSRALACSAGVRCSNPALMFPASPSFVLHVSFSLPLPFSFTLSFSLPFRRSLSRDPL